MYKIIKHIKKIHCTNHFMKLFSRYILLWSKQRLVVNFINKTRAAYVAETRRKQKGTIRTQIYLYYNTYTY